MKRKNQKKSADALRPVRLFERGVDFLIESFLYYTVINARGAQMNYPLSRIVLAFASKAKIRRYHPSPTSDRFSTFNYPAHQNWSINRIKKVRLYWLFPVARIWNFKWIRIFPKRHIIICGFAQLFVIHESLISRKNLFPPKLVPSSGLQLRLQFRNLSNSTGFFFRVTRIENGTAK